MLSRFPVWVAALATMLAFATPARAQDPGDMVVRLGRLETQVRQLSGQIEQLQFENRRLTEQLRKFQEDVDFRLQERSAGGAKPAPRTTAPAPASPPTGQPAPQRRSDVFDPASDPSAPGAPQPLGSPRSASAPVPGSLQAGSQRGPASLGQASPRVPQGAIATGGVGIIDDEEGDGQDMQPAQGGPARMASVPDPSSPLDIDARAGGVPRVPSVAAAGAANSREEYEGAYAFLLQRQYESAEMGFRRFLQSYPRDRLVPDATYWLGESYYQRGRYREAAEQFLKISTDYSGSGKGPDSLVKLSMALSGIGAHEQACATLGEVTRKYPGASVDVRQAAEREKRRAKC